MMSDWTELFKKTLQGERLILPEDDWEKMSRMLDRHVWHKKLRSAVSIAIAVAAAAATIFLFLPQQKQDEKIPTYEIAEVEKASPIDSNEPLICDNPESINIKLAGNNATPAEAIQLSEQIVEHEVFDNTQRDIDTTRSYTAKKDSSLVDRHPIIEQENRWTWLEAEESSRKKPIMFSLSKSLISSSFLRSDAPSIINNTNPDNGQHFGDKDENNPANSNENQTIIFIPNNQSQPIELNHIQYEHSYPYTIGIALGIPLSDKLFLTSGLDYSYCLSKITFSDNTKADQKAHYLGIPLHLDWMIIRNNRLFLYAGAGAEAYKCLFAQIGPQQRIKDGNTYYSAIILAGLKYEPVRNIGLFLEPQYSYTIPVKDPLIRSAITDSRNLFNARIGVSFRF
jgi:hypothetical protein